MKMKNIRCMRIHSHPEHLSGPLESLSLELAGECHARALHAHAHDFCKFLRHWCPSDDQNCTACFGSVRGTMPASRRVDLGVGLPVVRGPPPPGLDVGLGFAMSV